MIQVGSDIFYSTNDFSTLFDAGFRIGLPLPKGSDMGIEIYNTGLIVDLKIPFYSFKPLRTAVDLEYDIYQYSSTLTAISPSFILDIELSSFINFFLSLKWRYPAVAEIDSILGFTSINGSFMSGIAFYPRFGLELFRNLNFSILLEGGPVMSWYSRDIGINSSGMVCYKF